MKQSNMVIMVIVDGGVCNWKSILNWLARCSVLRPILYLIYTNDLE